MSAAKRQKTSTASVGPTLLSIKYDGIVGTLDILNQRKLPMETEYDRCKGVEDGWTAINSMRVRGAPAIAIVGVLSLVVELQTNKQIEDLGKLAAFIEQKLAYLVTARPTAVNMTEAAKRMTASIKTLVSLPGATVQAVQAEFVKQCEQFLPDDIADNRAIGRFGAEAIMALPKSKGRKVRVLTHCNTGSLATAGYGTALGVIRALHEAGDLDHAYCTETRPYNQGCRLTAFELVYEKIPSTLVVDSMAAALMKEHKIDAVVVGADRVVANGDTANKIGTYQLAILAAYHNIPYYIAAPKTSIDLTMQHGDEIEIEQRPKDELTSINGQRIAAPGIGVWNPAFDVAPAEIITGIITEVGVATKAPGQDKYDLASYCAANEVLKHVKHAYKKNRSDSVFA